MNGKGDKNRVKNFYQYRENYDKIFKKPKKKNLPVSDHDSGA